MSCLHLVYNLFSPDLLQRVRDKRQASCTDKDGAAFQLPAGWSVLNEIGKAFSIARASWHHFSASGYTNIRPWAHTPAERCSRVSTGRMSRSGDPWWQTCRR